MVIVCYIFFVISGLIAGNALTELNCLPNTWMWWAIAICPAVSHTVGFVAGRKDAYKKACKEVRFDKYCHKCKHEKLDDIDEPCYECLKNPVNLHSRVPVKFEEEKKK